MLVAVLAGFGAGMLSPALHRLAGRWTGVLLALVPAALFVWFLRELGPVQAGEYAAERWAWAPQLMLELVFRLDRLSLLMALLITGIGALVTLYAGRYLQGHPQLGRFYLFFFTFLASMLGLVLSDNLLALFVFWELTSLSSYLLIGFEHGRAEARASALQGLFVTVGGGQALLLGILLLGFAAGTLEISQFRGEVLREHALYPAATVLVLVGAFTKSAQFPFHFWLPGAMAAPTPVSAYLHSATMVKAGVFLTARLTPALGGTPLWEMALMLTGGCTMLVGAWLSVGEKDLKRILAFATVSVLGVLMFLVGLGTEMALRAAAVYLLAHALYKGALFLAAGAVDHSAGTRDILLLGGLRRTMPITFAAVVLASVSMAGLLPAFGFIGKELVYEAALGEAHALFAAPTAVAVLAFVPLVAVAGILTLRPFMGQARELPHAPHEAPFSMWLGPAVLAGLGIVLGLWPGWVSGLLLLEGSTGGGEEVAKLSLWHGFTPALGMSAVSVAGGVGVYLLRDVIRRGFTSLALHRWGPARLYELTLVGLVRVATFQTRVLQSGYLRRYLLILLLTIGTGVGYAVLAHTDAWPRIELGGMRPYELALGVIIVAAAIAAVVSRSRLGSIAALGVVGFGVALLFLFFGAPDLALTQGIVEALTVVVFFLALFHFPQYQELSSRWVRARDLVVSLAFGALMTTLVLMAQQQPVIERISRYFLERSVPDAHGRNVVNVILVDFRALDTLGEVTVLVVAALGVAALLKLGRRRRTEP